MTLDRLGMMASVGCMIHCVLVPFVLPFIPLIGLAHDHEGVFHLAMVGIVAVIGIPAMVFGARKHHDIRPTIVFCIGFFNLLLTGIGEAIWAHDNLTIPTLLGSILVVGSHIINHKLGCSCSCEHGD